MPQFIMLVLAGFSATALIVAVVGICRVLSYWVTQCRQEFYIRLALGAERADILCLILRQGIVLAAVGIVAGLLASLLLTRLMSSLLYKTGAHDPITFVLIPLLFFVIALLASHLPARRATKVNPIEALR